MSIADGDDYAARFARVAQDIRDVALEEERDSCAIKLRDLPRFDSGSYGGMPEREDGKYFRVPDVIDLLTKLSLTDDPAGELIAQLQDFAAEAR